MKSSIVNLSEKKLVGKSLPMSLANNKVGELWKSFMPRLAEIKQRVSNDLISLAIYSPGYFDEFDPAKPFVKWACAEVADFDHVPAGFETLLVADGLYMVFEYKGSSTDSRVYQYIFGSYLPASDYQLDHRPHFEVLGARYKNADPESEEEIWIPVKPKLAL